MQRHEITPQSLPLRGLDKARGHKFSYGHALVVCGGAGRTGAARLAARGRESTGEISERLSRVAEPLPGGVRLQRIDNSGAIAATVADIRACLYPETVIS